MTIPLDDVLEFIFEGVTTEYGQADAEGMVWTPDGPLAAAFDGAELLFLELGIEVAHYSLQEDIEAAARGFDWCERAPLAPRAHEQSVASWRHFSQFVKHRVRYVVYEYREPADNLDLDRPIRPHEMLDHVAEHARAVPGLITEWPTGKRVWRARWHATEAFSTASGLGPPPPERATKPNRMSAPGIALMYGALERDTALAETAPHMGAAEACASVGAFLLTRPALILDLSSPPAMPSLFDPGRRHERSPLAFLHAFAGEISQPVREGDTGYFECAPTQFLTEYLCHIFRTNDGARLDGIAYRSSRRPTGTNVVLFAGAEACADEDAVTADTLLALNRGTVGSPSSRDRSVESGPDGAATGPSKRR